MQTARGSLVLAIAIVACRGDDRSPAASPPPPGRAPGEDRGPTAPDPVPGCLHQLKPDATASRSAVARELVSRCPASSMAHVLFAFERMASGADDEAERALARAIEIDTDWDAGSRAHALLVHRLIVARKTPSDARGLRMVGASMRQVMDIPGVTSGVVVTPGLDPQVMGIVNGWIDLTGTIASIALSQGRGAGGGDLMWIPGVTDGSAGSHQRPVLAAIQEYRPFTVSPVPTGTVEGDAEECRRRVNERCKADDDRLTEEHFACLDDCKSRHRGDDAAIRRCWAGCDTGYLQKKSALEQRCGEELRRCTPAYSSTGSTHSAMGVHASVIHAEDPCVRHTSCASCTASDQCGWCASSSTCVRGTPGHGVACASGWQPFQESCADPCTTSTTCASCTQRECGWCEGNATCYSGTPAAPSTGECMTSWRPFPTMCQ